MLGGRRLPFVPLSWCVAVPSLLLALPGALRQLGRLPLLERLRAGGRLLRRRQLPVLVRGRKRLLLSAARLPVANCN